MLFKELTSRPDFKNVLPPIVRCSRFFDRGGGMGILHGSPGNSVRLLNLGDLAVVHILSTAFLKWSFLFGCRWYISSQDRQNIWLLHRSHRTAGVAHPHKAHDFPCEGEASSFVGIGSEKVKLKNLRNKSNCYSKEVTTLVKFYGKSLILMFLFLRNKYSDLSHFFDIIISCN